MKPSVDFHKADQMRLRSLRLERSSIPAPGRVMFCRGRKVLGHGDVGKLADFQYIPKGADTLCLSSADFDEVHGWIW